VAILLVLVDHSLSPLTERSWGSLGSAGVEVFFALSGFLITALLLEEWADQGRISLRRFYARRARRLLPALAVLIAAMAVLRPLVLRLSHVDLMPDPWPTILYLANWSRVAHHDLGALNPTWSLAVEEQFYFVWPLALLAVLRWRRGPLVLASVVIIGSTLLRFTLDGDRVRIYDGSDTQAGALMVGALLAILAHRGLRPLRVQPWVPAAVALASFGWAAIESVWASSVLVPTVVPVVTAVVIWAACSSPGGPLEWAWLGYVGRRSYAVYLWHTPIAWLTEALLGGKSFAVLMLSVAVTFGVAELSWRLVEAPFLNRSRRSQGVEGKHRGAPLGVG
jgi:peptidoglycan/LPS O-acetylase OafA/YrhL